MTAEDKAFVEMYNQLKRLFSDQEDLGPEYQKVLDDNYDALITDTDNRNTRKKIRDKEQSHD